MYYIFLSIPLQDDFEDEWAWHYDSSGVFSVKTAYKMLRQMQQMTSTREAGQSSAGSNTLNWKNIWKLKCPPRM